MVANPKKTSNKLTIFSQKHTEYAFMSKLKHEIAMKFDEKSIRKTEIWKKQAQKTSKFQLKQAQKQATRNSTKKQAQIHGKTARLATLMLVL